MLRVLSLTVALSLFGAGAADASFLLDDFEVPGAGSQFSDGSTVVLPTPANYFSDRTMDDNTVGAPSSLTVSSGTFNGLFVPGDTAFIEWTGATTTPSSTAVANAGFADLELLNFSETGIPGSVSYQVFLNGTDITVGGGPRVLLADGLLKTVGAQITAPTDTLNVTFFGVGALGQFQADGIQANPEPMSAGLLGLALFGGVCRHRRRRKLVS